MSHTHPDEDAKLTNAPRLSEDTGYATGDNERRPDTPTEPPDQPAGTTGQEGELWVKMRMSGTSRERGGGMGDEGNDEH